MSDDDPIDACATALRHMTEPRGEAALTRAFAVSMVIRYARIDARPWLGAVRRLRDADVFHPDVAHYLIDIYSNAAAEVRQNADPENIAVRARMREIEARLGFSDDFPIVEGEGTPEWERLRRRSEAIFYRCWTAVMMEAGEAAMVRDLREREEEYDAAIDHGMDILAGRPHRRSLGSSR